MLHPTHQTRAHFLRVCGLATVGICLVPPLRLSAKPAAPSALDSIDGWAGEALRRTHREMCTHLAACGASHALADETLSPLTIERHDGDRLEYTTAGGGRVIVYRKGGVAWVRIGAGL